VVRGVEHTALAGDVERERHDAAGERRPRVAWTSARYRAARARITAAANSGKVSTPKLFRLLDGGESREVSVWGLCRTGLRGNGTLRAFLDAVAD
jgi:hypothetical protein